MRRRSDKPAPEGSSERLTLRQADQARADLYAIHDELDIIHEQLARLPTRRDLARVALIGVLAGAALTVAAVELFGRGL
jgi:hypothetical protein